MSASKQKETIERTSKLLLSGWKMLALSCPICNTVLMENRSGEKQCPSCNLPVKLQSDVEKMEVTEEKIAAPVVEEPKRQSYDELRDSYEKNNKKRNQVSSLIGQKLLMGWAMLEQSCPDMDTCGGTPLMRERADGPSQCLSCLKMFHITHGIVSPVDTEASNPAAPAAAPALPTASTATAAFDEDNSPWESAPILNFSKNNDTKDSSWKISQKLLQGWALLDKTCNNPKCCGDIPLMRDKNGKQFCVECGYADSLDGGLQKTTAAVAFRAKSPVASISDEDDDDDELDEIEASFLINSLVQKVASESRPPSKPAALAAKPVKSSRSADPVSEVEQLILQKLLSTAQQLNDDADVKTTGEIASLLCKLAEAAKAVKSINN